MPELPGLSSRTRSVLTLLLNQRALPRLIFNQGVVQVPLLWQFQQIGLTK